MRVDRCVKTSMEVVNGEMFIRVPGPCLSMSGPTGQSSCWVPTEVTQEVLKYKQDNEEKMIIFFIVQLVGTEMLYSATEMITFSGGDVLALVVPIGMTVFVASPGKENTIQ